MFDTTAVWYVEALRQTLLLFPFGRHEISTRIILTPWYETAARNAARCQLPYVYVVGYEET